MEHFYTIAAAGLGILAALGHSYLGETNLLGPLYREGASSILTRRRARDLIRLVWHLPGAIWALVGLFLLVFPDDAPLRNLAAIIYAVSALVNLAALRKPHIGGIGLAAAALLLVLG